MNSCLYEGVLRHRRLQPKAHHFRYRIFMAWLDLDELDLLSEVGIRRNSFAAASFYDADYPLGTPLKAQVLNRLESLTGARPDGRVMLLTQLRYLGFHFNPVNFYYCYDGAGALRWVLAEVRNTPWTANGRVRWIRPFTSRRLTRWTWSITGDSTGPVKRCICILRTIRRQKSSMPRWP